MSYVRIFSGVNTMPASAATFVGKANMINNSDLFCGSYFNRVSASQVDGTVTGKKIGFIFYFSRIYSYQ
jgi:hypothetical protein